MPGRRSSRLRVTGPSGSSAIFRIAVTSSPAYRRLASSPQRSPLVMRICSRSACAGRESRNRPTASAGAPRWPSAETPHVRLEVRRVDLHELAALERIDAGLKLRAQRLQLQRVLTAPLLEDPQRVPHGLARILVLTGLYDHLDEGVQLGRQADVPGRHWLRALPADKGDSLQPLSGILSGPTVQGVADLINLDPDAMFDAIHGVVINSCAPSPSCGSVSPRLVAIAVFDPARFEWSLINSGQPWLSVTKFIGVFIDGVVGGKVTGYITALPSMNNPEP